MPHIGDKSDAYAQLRKDYDGMDLPKVEQRYNFKTMPMESDNKNAPDAYNIHNCPDHPPEGLLFRRRLSLFVIGISLWWWNDNEWRNIIYSQPTASLVVITIWN